jgi:hypothetical protein
MVRAASTSCLARQTSDRGRIYPIGGCCESDAVALGVAAVASLRVAVHKLRVPT